MSDQPASHDYYIDPDDEGALTKGQYDQIRFDVTLDGAFTSLTDDERAELESQVKALDIEAAKKALNTLVLRHPVEFHALLREQREERNLTHQLRSEFSDILAIAEKNSLTF